MVFFFILNNAKFLPLLFSLFLENFPYFKGRFAGDKSSQSFENVMICSSFLKYFHWI